MAMDRGVLIAFYVVQLCVVLVLVYLSGVQAIKGKTANRSKAWVHRLNFFSSIVLLIMAVDVQRSYGIYHPAVLVVLWTVVKSAVIVSVSTILYHILEAQAKIRNRNVPEPVFYVCVGVAAFAFCMDLAELISALFSSAGALFTAIQFFIFSVVSLFTFKPMVFVREQQQDTVEALRSSRKEGFHRTINDHGVFKALIKKLNRLIIMTIGVAAVCFIVGGLLLTRISMYEIEFSLFRLHHHQLDNDTFALEVVSFLALCFLLAWPVYYSWVSVQWRPKERTRSASRRKSMSRSRSRISPKSSVLKHYHPRYLSASSIGTFRKQSAPGLETKESSDFSRRISLSQSKLQLAMMENRSSRSSITRPTRIMHKKKPSPRDDILNKSAPGLFQGGARTPGGLRTPHTPAFGVQQHSSTSRVLGDFSPAKRVPRLLGTSPLEVNRKEYSLSLRPGEIKHSPSVSGTTHKRRLTAPPGG